MDKRGWIIIFLIALAAYIITSLGCATIPQEPSETWTCTYETVSPYMTKEVCKRIK